MDFVENDVDCKLPGYQDLNEVQLMKNFAYEVNYAKLLQDLRGRGAFRRFKDDLAQFYFV